MASAQDNPFGDGRAAGGSDPFGGSSEQGADDPFGGSPEGSSDDPFGGSAPRAAADPFGGRPKPRPGDPFGRSTSSDRAREIARDRAVSRVKDAGVELARSAAETEAMLRAALKGKTAISADGLPLNEFVRQLSEKHEIPILIDRRSLEEIGLTDDVPIDLNISGISLSSTLRLALRPLELTYMIKDDVLQVMTLEAAELNLTIRTFEIPELLNDKSDQLVKLIQRTVNPAAWDAIGGPCHVTAVGHVLVVSSTEQTHEDVADLMEKIAAAAARRQKSRPVR